MKKKKNIVAMVLIIVLLLSSCGGNKDMKSDNDEQTSINTGESTNGTVSYDKGSEAEESAPENAISVEEGTAQGAPGEEKSIQVESGRKLIRTIDIAAETQEYDKMIAAVETKVRELGGYIESSTVDGTGYDNVNKRNSGYVIRIPKDKVDAFVSAVKSTGNVIRKEESTRDVTLEYVDTESHKKALDVEYERLLAILEKATTLEEIIALETRLSVLRYEMGNYESQIRTYDNLVDYGTVSLQISEVERMTAVDVDSTGDKMKNGIQNTYYEIVEGIQNFAVWFVTILPYLAIWAVIFFCSLLGAKKWNKKRKNKVVQEPSGQIGEMKSDKQDGTDV